MSHTKEPWHCFNDEVMDEQERTIAHILTSGYEMESYTAKDARRIVACVNACAGIPTESLEAGMFDDPSVRITITALEAKVRELEAENFALSAGSCCEIDGLTADEGGVIYCRKVKQLAYYRQQVERLSAFHAFFRNRCEWLFAEFGMPVIDLYNSASEAIAAVEKERGNA